MGYRHYILLPEKKIWSHLHEIVCEKREQEIDVVIPEKMQDLSLGDGSLEFLKLFFFSFFLFFFPQGMNEWIFIMKKIVF